MNTSPEVNRILVVTGMSGAGKSTVLQVLDDLGWEAIDNFPLRLIGSLVHAEGERHAPIAVGCDTRTRGFAPSQIIEQCEELRAGATIELTTLFLDCSAGELARRYNETRRPHPMARNRPLAEGIEAERELLDPLRNWADILIDTSNLGANQLQRAVRERFGTNDAREMTITVTSFGFARGMPPLADLLFDMRFLDNPHWVAGLRDLTGKDEAVARHIEDDPAFKPAFDRIIGLLLDLLPRYARQDRSYCTIAFGCTGGRHRSVYTAEAAARVLRDAGFSPTVTHRNLDSGTADPLERN